MSIEPALPAIIGHRGASYDAPEHTMVSYRLAQARGADGFECDVRQTTDGQIVCIHDATTARVAPDHLPSLTVSEATADELRTVDVGRWRGGRYAGERVPLLAEALSAVAPGRGVFIEVKDGPETVEPLHGVIEASGVAPDRLTVIAFDAEVVAASKRAMPAIRANWITGFEQNGTRDWEPDIGRVIDQLEGCGADGLSCQASLHLDHGSVRELRTRGFGWHVWTVNDVPTAEHFYRLGVDSITTDRPGWLRTGLVRNRA